MDYLVDTIVLDEGIRELVVKFNELPFLYTTSSGAGHFLTRDVIIARNPRIAENMLRLPPEGQAFHVAGHLMFNTNGTLESERFIADLQSFLDSKFKNMGIMLLKQPPISFQLELGKSIGLGDVNSAEKLKEIEANLKRKLFLFVSSWK